MHVKSECDQCGACCTGVLIVEIDHLDVVREPKLIAVALSKLRKFEAVEGTGTRGEVKAADVFFE